MKREYFLLLAIAIFLFVMPSQVFAVSAYPNPVSTTQPDGTPLTVRIFGDEWYHFYESEDGYTILQKADGWWVYTDLDLSGRYVSSEFRVSKKVSGLERFLKKVGKHLREDKKYQAERKDRFFKKTLPGLLDKAGELGKAKGLVTMNVPVILIQYLDFFASQTRQSFDDMMNQSNYNGTGSFRDYYYEVSYGKVTVNATVVGWYTAPEFRSYYAANNPDYYDYCDHIRELARSAVDAAEGDGMNFANFDNDGDGNVDIVLVAHQGPGAEGGNLNYIWSHHWYLYPGGGWSDLRVTYDGRQIDRYALQPEISGVHSGQHIEIGVFCHEFGHALGLPDLYDVNSSNGASEGVGLWCLMGSGSWGGDQSTPQLPTHLCAWSKKELGWLTPINVTSDMGLWILPVEDTSIAFRLWTNGALGKQYFLVELRKKKKFEINLPTEGLAIWHIDENQRRTDNQDNADETHKLVDLEEADGLNHLDNQVNRGDAADLFPGSSNNYNFNNGTNPNSKDYGGGNTLVQVNNITTGTSYYTAMAYVQAVTPPDLVIRDCGSDIGAKPDNQCISDWVRSPDIWVDNNDDGIIDEPVKGQPNHLYIRTWNIGGTTTQVKVRCWYVNPSLGLRFPGSAGTQILDYPTANFEKTISIMGNTPLPSPPQPKSLYTVYFNWLIPTPPPDIDHYCIGCAVYNASDPKTSDEPLADNNLGQINYWALAEKAGQTPVGLRASDGATTIFREKIRVNNPTHTHDWFVVRAENIPPGWSVSYDSFPNFIAPDTPIVITVDVSKPLAQHRDSATIAFKLYRYSDDSLFGGLWHDYRIDDMPPAAPVNFVARRFQLLGDNYTRPTPTVEVTWGNPGKDTGGYVEKVNYYKIYRSTDSTFMPNDSTLIGKTALDRDLFKAGYQWYDYVNTKDTSYYYAVVAVDKTGSSGVPTPIKPVSLCPVQRGDANSDNKLTVSDVVYLVNYLFKGGRTPDPFCRGEVNCDGKVTISDVVYLVNYLFKGGPPPCY